MLYKNYIHPRRREPSRSSQYGFRLRLRSVHHLVYGRLLVTGTSHDVPVVRGYVATKHRGRFLRLEITGDILRVNDLAQFIEQREHPRI